MLAIAAILCCTAAGDASRPVVAFRPIDGGLEVTIGGRPVASYFQEHDKVARPFFAHITTPAGIPVTRTFPPVSGRDKTDHPAMHPGVWLAFGDLGGSDFWRNAGPRVVHDKFISEPTGGAGEGSFAVLNRYEARGKAVARETARYRVLARPAGTLLLIDSTFEALDPAGFAFGDQEEMGLGIRLATPLSVAGGGAMTGPDGGRNEKGVRGKAADWCDARRTLDGKTAGVMVMADPANFRKPWWHARDYGLVVANPFARNSLAKGEPSRVGVKPGEPLRLRFGVLVYDGTPDPAASFAEFAARLGGRR